MQRTSAKLVLTVFAMLMAAVSSTHAAVISTGTAGIGVLETNWSVVEIAPTATPLTSFGVSGAAAYPGAWVAAPTGSNWISPYVDAATQSTAVDDPDSKGALPNGTCAGFQNGGGACYQYTLAAFNDPGAPVSVSWASDNGANFYLNGVLVSTIAAPDVNDQPFASLTTFLLSGFQATGNIITVDVTNLLYDPNNPTGLLGSATATVPETTTLGLIGLGLIGLGAMRRRRRKDAKILALV